jgi:hypothetical protein
LDCWSIGALEQWVKNKKDLHAFITPVLHSIRTESH